MLISLLNKSGKSAAAAAEPVPGARVTSLLLQVSETGWRGLDRQITLKSLR